MPWTGCRSHVCGSGLDELDHRSVPALTAAAGSPRRPRRRPRRRTAARRARPRRPAVAVRPQVRLVRRPQGQVPRLGHDQRLLVDARADQHQPLGRPGDDAVVRRRTGAAVASSACTTAATISAGAAVGGRAAVAPASRSRVGRLGVARTAELVVGHRTRGRDRVQPRESLQGRAAERRHQPEQLGRHPDGAAARSRRPRRRGPPRATRPSPRATRTRGRRAAATRWSARGWSAAAPGRAASRRSRRGPRRTPRPPPRARPATQGGPWHGRLGHAYPRSTAAPGSLGSRCRHHPTSSAQPVIRRSHPRR